MQTSFIMSFIIMIMSCFDNISTPQNRSIFILNFREKNTFVF